MAIQKPILLFVSDLYYQAQQRTYYEEDIFLTSQLRDEFKLVICHPLDTEPFENLVDAIIFRNTGPTVYYKKQYQACRKRLIRNNVKVFNGLTGKADMLGKQYLVDLSQSGFPVIPTIDSERKLDTLPDSQLYVLKPKDAADSIGMKFFDRKDIHNVNFDNILLQPMVDFKYEVSFYFIDKKFQYAMYAPDNNKRWKMEEYSPTDADLDFGMKFIDWNDIEHGIQRVDACRTQNGDLLLVELEDLNPYLSILEIQKEKQIKFIDNLKKSLFSLINE